MKKITKISVSKPKKVLEEVKELEVKQEIKEVLSKPASFVYGDIITDTLTGKSFHYHYQHKVDENPSRFILLAPNL